jgi:hypothetical protein
LKFFREHPTLDSMKTVLRTIVFLVMLFAFLYVGIYNTHPIKFSFPLLEMKDVDQPAALIYFGMFAVGVVAGLALGSGGQKSKPAAPEAKKKA